MPNYVDPSVCRAKFDREIEQFKSIQNEYIKRGIWLLKVEYPIVLVAFAKAMNPLPGVVFGALIDFTDYDLRALSVTIVNPFTQIPLKANEVPVQFVRGTVQAPQALLQTHSDNKPFLCLPGIREYHEHPAHTGDSWLLRRGTGEGTLHFVVENLHRYGVEGVMGYQMSMNIAIQVRPIE